MRILQVKDQQKLIQLMRDIKVDPYGIKIMLPKASSYLVRINSLSNIAANILKQEMLSLGADVAVARDTLTGKTRDTACLLMGNLSHFARLSDKLQKQPFGLSALSSSLKCALDNYSKEKFTLELGAYKLRLGKRTAIMGIVNMTPDSFSGDGLYRYAVNGIVDYAQKLVKDGADIIDVGGESSRPGAKAISLKEELRRVVPVVKILAKKIKVPVSIDTYKPKVAKLALDNGAVMVNDISGLRNPLMGKVVASYKAAVVIMHMKGNPRTMQKNPRFISLIDDILGGLNLSIAAALKAGIDREKIIIDPGIGFGKTSEHNLQILNNLREFKVLGRPLLAGVSRKSFIGKLLNKPPLERINGTIASTVLAVNNGAKIIRAHDVSAVREALKVADAIIYG